MKNWFYILLSASFLELYSAENHIKIEVMDPEI